MPIALDPDQTFEVVLKTDQSKPPESRPTFVFRYLTERALRKARKFGADKEAHDRMAFDEIIDGLKAEINNHLATWRNLTPDERPIEDIGDVCTIQELWQLYYAMLAGGSLDVESKKNSDMPSPDSGEKSVETTAPETPQNAETVHLFESPPK